MQEPPDFRCPPVCLPDLTHRSGFAWFAMHLWWEHRLHELERARSKLSEAELDWLAGPGDAYTNGAATVPAATLQPTSATSAAAELTIELPCNRRIQGATTQRRRGS